MLRATDYMINDTDEIYNYFHDGCSLTNNLYNATLFRLRQLMTGLKKDAPAGNELEVIREVETALPKMNAIRKAANDAKANRYKKAVAENLSLPKEKRKEIKEPKYSQPFVMPDGKKWMVSHVFMAALMKVTENPDYKAMPSAQLAQSAVKAACGDMSATMKSIKEYGRDPSKYLARPQIPKYKKKGGLSTMIFTNQDCRIRNGVLFFPNTKYSLPTGNRPGVLKQVTVKPWHGKYVVHIIMELPDPEKAPKEPRRIMNFDVGVNNTAAITNNAGKPCILFKGGTIKSINQYFNKKTAAIVSAQTLATGKKFVPTQEFHDLCIKREAKIHDLLRKTAKMAVEYAMLWEIDTIVFGKNKLWKQNSNMGHVKNQEFVQIPFAYFEQCLQSLCEETGINFIEQEESYTSQASFPDGDKIPVYKVNDSEKAFSGRRSPNLYKGQRKKGGFHGLYQTKDGTIINADLNGSANIGRKHFQDMYTWEGAFLPDFSNVIVIKHPELWDMHRNRAKQEHKKSASGQSVSKSKQRRLKRKQNCGTAGHQKRNKQRRAA